MDVRATNLLQVPFQFVHMMFHVLDGNSAERRISQFVAQGFGQVRDGCLQLCLLLARAAALSHFSSFLM